MINDRLRDIYQSNFEKAVSGVFGKVEYGDKYFEIATQAQINAERFAAYKAYQVTEQLKALDTKSDKFDEQAKGVINTFNRYQTTEYNTMMSRSRTARQWQQFQENKELYPNIMWLPSRSAHQREEHQAYYYHIWTKDDPFWDENQPGNEYNCKCDWTETDKEPTDNEDIEPVTPSPGLNGNPGDEGELITDDHPYIDDAPDQLEDTVSNMLRNDYRNEAYSLVGKEVSNEIDGDKINIEITKSGIKHMAGDFDENRNFKNALLPIIDDIIKSAKYVASAENYNFVDQMTKQYHYFEFNVLGRKGYINVAEDVNGKYRFHAYRDRLAKKRK